MVPQETESFVHEVLKAIRDDIAELKDGYQTIDKRTRAIELYLERRAGFISGVAFTAAGIGGFIVWLFNNAAHIATWLTRGNSA